MVWKGLEEQTREAWYMQNLGAAVRKMTMMASLKMSCTYVLPAALSAQLVM